MSYHHTITPKYITVIIIFEPINKQLDINSSVPLNKVSVQLEKGF